MKTKFLALVLLLLPLSSYGSFSTGEMLHQNCGESGLAGFSACQSYIAGVVDAVDTLVRVDKLPPYFCPSKTVLLVELVDVVKRYLVVHKDARGGTASSTIIKSLAEAFPCPTQ